MGELQDTASHVVIVGRGKVIADTSVADLLALTSGNGVMLRTAAPAQAATVLANAGAEVAATGPGMLVISGLPAERAVVLLSEHAIPFSEVTPHRATLEQAYLELTKDAIEYRSGGSAGLAGRAAS
jgi:ABC-2 type transport system ATP-binding protein